MFEELGTLTRTESYCKMVFHNPRISQIILTRTTEHREEILTHPANNNKFRRESPFNMEAEIHSNERVTVVSVGNHTSKNKWPSIK